MTDYLIAVCKLCGHTVRISLEHEGRRAKCPKCEGIIDIPKSETSIRLRSDRELTREARAKAGRGPDSDLDTPAPGLAGRHTSVRMRRAAVKQAPPARKWTLIVTLVATAALIGGIAIILLRKPSGDSAAPAPAGAQAPVKKPVAPPTPAPKKEEPADPRASEIEAIKTRAYKYVKVFNLNDMTKLQEFYSCDLTTLTKAFGNILNDSELTYEDVTVTNVEFADPKIMTTLSFTRVRKYTEGGKVVKEEGVKRVLVWVEFDGKKVITSAPEP